MMIVNSQTGNIRPADYNDNFATKADLEVKQNKKNKRTILYSLALPYF